MKCESNYCNFYFPEKVQFLEIKYCLNVINKKVYSTKLVVFSPLETAPKPCSINLRLESLAQTSLPIIFEPHSDFPNVSSSVEFCQNPAKGRHLIASKDIEAGEVLIVDGPSASFLSGTRWASNCHHCCRPLRYTLVPSPLQSNVIFCGIGCCHAAMNSYHIQESRFNLR